MIYKIYVIMFVVKKMSKININDSEIKFIYDIDKYPGTKIIKDRVLNFNNNLYHVQKCGSYLQALMTELASNIGKNLNLDVVNYKAFRSKNNKLEDNNSNKIENYIISKDFIKNSKPIPVDFYIDNIEGYKILEKVDKKYKCNGNITKKYLEQLLFSLIIADCDRFNENIILLKNDKDLNLSPYYDMSTTYLVELYEISHDKYHLVKENDDRFQKIHKDFIEDFNSEIEKINNCSYASSYDDISDDLDERVLFDFVLSKLQNAQILEKFFNLNIDKIISNIKTYNPHFKFIAKNLYEFRKQKLKGYLNEYNKATTR